MKAYRELISYKAPSSGDSAVIDEIDIIWLCTLLSEIAQYNSEILETSITKNADRNAFVFNQSYIGELCNHSVDSFEFYDSEDRYRLDYLRELLLRIPKISCQHLP